MESDSPHTGISKSFFYRAHSAWNKLPLEIRKIELPILFKKKVTEHLWKEVFDNIDIIILEDLNQSLILIFIK